LKIIISYITASSHSSADAHGSCCSNHNQGTQTGNSHPINSVDISLNNFISDLTWETASDCTDQLENTLAFEEEYPCDSDDESIGGDGAQKIPDMSTKRRRKLNMMCQQCGSACLREVNDTKTSDFSLCDRALFKVDLEAMANVKCHRRCFKQNCGGKVTLFDVIALRKKVWLNADGSLRNRQSRRAAVYKLLNESHSAFARAGMGNLKLEDQFLYQVGTVVVCENVYMQLLGLVVPDSKLKWKGWNDMKSSIVSYILLDQSQEEEEEEEGSSDSPEAYVADRKIKSRHAIAYIQMVLDSLICDYTAFSGKSETIILPYRKIPHFYAEYEVWCEVHNVKRSCRAGERTFTYAYAAMKTELKIDLQLQDERGGFDTCEICNNADFLLKTREGWTSNQKRIILDFRRLHLIQQQRERMYLDSNMLKAQELDEVGQPICAVLFSDGMSDWKGQ
jgi:hypothetical protein